MTFNKFASFLTQKLEHYWQVLVPTCANYLPEKTSHKNCISCIKKILHDSWCFITVPQFCWHDFPFYLSRELSPLKSLDKSGQSQGRSRRSRHLCSRRQIVQWIAWGVPIFPATQAYFASLAVLIFVWDWRLGHMIVQNGVVFNLSSKKACPSLCSDLSVYGLKENRPISKWCDKKDKSLREAGPLSIEFPTLSSMGAFPFTSWSAWSYWLLLAAWTWKGQQLS